jgi:ribosomal protein L37AE/L43A
MATYLDYAGRDGERPERWPNLREAATKPWMGQTAVIGSRPWLVIGFDGEMYELENELGARMRSNKFEVLEYESDNNKLVAASRSEGSPFVPGVRLVASDCEVGGLDFDRDSYEWAILTDEGDTIDVEARVSDLEEADWKVADTYDHPGYNPDLDIGRDTDISSYYCPECGSADVDFGDNIAYCGDCGWHGGQDEVMTDHDRAHDFAEESPRLDPYPESDWQHGASMDKGSPYPENSEKNAPDHSPKGQEWPKKVNEIYNACMREGNGRGDTKEEKESSCAAIAWAQYKKNKKSHDEDRVLALEGRGAKIVQEEGKFAVKSADGKRTLGSAPTMEGAKAIRDIREADSEYENAPTEPLKCPKCESHTVELVNSEKKEFACHACGHHFTHDEIILNPKSPKERKGGIGDYQHWNEEAPRVWYEEEGRHPMEPAEYDPEDYDRQHGAEDAAWEELYDHLSGLDDVELQEMARGEFRGDYPYAEHLDPSAVKDLAYDVLAERGGNSQMYRSKFMAKKQAATFQLMDSDGTPVTSGQYYNLHGDNYKIPDVIKILDITPEHIVATVEDNSTPLKISAEDVETNGYSFEKLPIYSNIEKHDLREAVSWSDAGENLKTNLGWDNWPNKPREAPVTEQEQEFTLPTPSGGTLWVRADNDGHVTGWSVPSVDGGPGQYSNRDLEHVQSMVDDARAEAVRDQGGIPNFDRDRDQRFFGKNARRAFTPGEQKKLIEEKGEARNKDKLVLEDSHYIESTVEDDLDFLF